MLIARRHHTVKVAHSGSALPTRRSCSCGLSRARARRWSSTPTTERSPSSAGTASGGSTNNMKTAVETIFVGRERAYNRRFLQMCSHYLVEPRGLTPATGWEKGRSRTSRLVRERLFTPRVRVRSYYELNALLLDGSSPTPRPHPHPEQRDLTIWQALRSRTGSPGPPTPDASTASTRAGSRVLDLPGALRQQQVLCHGLGHRSSRSRCAPMPTH